MRKHNFISISIASGIVIMTTIIPHSGTVCLQQGVVYSEDALLRSGSAFNMFPLVLSQSVIDQNTNTVKYNVRWMWNPASDLIEEWQVLRRPRGITLDPWGNIIIADSGNDRLVRFTQEGVFIETISRRGSGPGDLGDPWDIAFTPNDSVLWVGEHRNQRVSRFQLSKDSSSFMDMFPAPQVRNSTEPGFAIIDSHTLALNTHTGESRISILDDHGVRFGQFGEPFQPKRELSNASAVNDGILGCRFNKEIYFVGVKSPVLEMWSVDGNRHASYELQFPEIAEARKRERSLSPSEVFVYIWAAYYVKERDTLFLCVSGGRFYEYSLGTHQTIRVHEWESTLKDPGYFVVVANNQTTRIIQIDYETNGVLIADSVRGK